MARIVVDASVVVSAPFGGDSATALLEILEHHQVILTESIVQELESLTKRVGEKVGKHRAKRFAQIVREILRRGRRVRIRRRITICRDPSDDKYLEAGLAGRAAVLVTRDKDLLMLPPDVKIKAGLRRLEILSPSAFVHRSGLH